MGKVAELLMAGEDENIEPLAGVDAKEEASLGLGEGGGVILGLIARAGQRGLREIEEDAGGKELGVRCGGGCLGEPASDEAGGAGEAGALGVGRFFVGGELGGDLCEEID